jgi:hypothetical protein
MISSKETSNLFCSIQRALIGKITPNLRAVYVLFKGENSFELILYYDQDLTEEEEELASLVDTEFISDFPSSNYNTSFVTKIIPFPNKVPKEGFCVYQRFEDNLLNQ